MRARHNEGIPVMNDTTRRRFVTICVNSTAEAILPMVEASIDISRRTFLRHVDRGELEELARQLCYADHPSQGLTMAGDWHISYHCSTYRGQRCYYFRHSAIEYIFI